MSDSPKEPPNTNYENQNPGDERPLFRDLLSRAHDLGLADIKTKAISISDPPERRAIFKATVTMRPEDGFVEYLVHSDCDDKNNHALIAPHYPRMTRNPSATPGRCARLPKKDAPVRKKCRRMMASCPMWTSSTKRGGQTTPPVKTRKGRSPLLNVAMAP